jgi:hypothetical protein
MYGEIVREKGEYLEIIRYNLINLEHEMSLEAMERPYRHRYYCQIVQNVARNHKQA